MENENEKSSKETASILLKHFDSIFHTNTSCNIDYYFSKLKMLQNIYNVLEEDLCTSNPQYKELRKQHIDITDMLENSLTKGQQALFEKHLDTGSEMVSVECEQMFYFRVHNGKGTKPRYNNRKSYKQVDVFPTSTLIVISGISSCNDN